jgi:tetratricopeptide (TPR) repeat protein
MSLFRFFLFLLCSSLLASCSHSPHTGNFEPAQAVEQVAVSPESSCAYFNFLWGNHAEYRGKFEEALAAYERARICDPSAHQITLRQATLLAEMGRLEDAVATLEDLLASTEDNLPARHLLAHLFVQLHLEEQAVEQYELILADRPGDDQVAFILAQLYQRLGNNSAALAQLGELIHGSESARARYQMASLYFEQNQYDQALAILDPIDAKQPYFLERVYLKTRILDTKEAADSALAMLTGYLDDASTRHPLFYLLASTLYRENGDTGKQDELITQGVRHFPNDVDLLYEYGVLLEQKGNTDAALTVMERIIMLDPDHADALNFIGYSWADDNRNLDEALAYIERAMWLKPGNGYIQDSLGWVHFRLGNLKQAKIELLEALDLMPEDPHIHDHLGDVYHAIGLLFEARAHYEAAIYLFTEPHKKDAVRRKIDALPQC